MTHFDTFKKVLLLVIAIVVLYFILCYCEVIPKHMCNIDNYNEKQMSDRDNDYEMSNINNDNAEMSNINNDAQMLSRDPITNTKFDV